MNKEVQQHFERGVEGDESGEIIRVMRKHVEQLYEVERIKEPVIKEVEKHIKHQIKNPQAS